MHAVLFCSRTFTFRAAAILSVVAMLGRPDLDPLGSVWVGWKLFPVNFAPHHVLHCFHKK